MEMDAYIDESGDAGIGGKGTKWFIITAMIVNAKEASELGETYIKIRNKIKIGQTKPLHWTSLSHPRKKALIDILKEKDFSFCSVIVDTEHVDIVNTYPKLSGRRLYHYSFRQLVERVTWYCDDRGYKVRIFPENQSGVSYYELKSYLEYIQKEPDCQIRKDCILDVKPKAKTQSNLLQLVDSLCGAVRDAVEYKFDTIEESYLMELKEKLYRRGDKLFGYGIKFMPHRSELIPQSLEGEFEWLKTI